MDFLRSLPKFFTIGIYHLGVVYKLYDGSFIPMEIQRSFTLQSIYRFFQTPRVVFLNQELTVCYLLSILVQGDSYGTEFVQKLKQDYPGYRLSDTILQSSLRFLDKEGFVTSYWKKPEKRGRPRRMYQLCPDTHQRAEELARLWHDYVATNPIYPVQEAVVVGS